MSSVLQECYERCTVLVPERGARVIGPDPRAAPAVLGLYLAHRIDEPLQALAVRGLLGLVGRGDHVLEQVSDEFSD